MDDTHMVHSAKSMMLCIAPFGHLTSFVTKYFLLAGRQVSISSLLVSKHGSTPDLVVEKE